jgi:ketosteroid isomerase-like protein
MKMRLLAGLLAAGPLLGCVAVAPPPDTTALREQVLATERAFAKTMADRDAVRFATFLSAEAVFDSGKSVTHGSRNIAALWSRLFEKPVAPFSWYPDRVDVLDSGTLAMSSGPVLDPQSRPIGRFTSIWRLEAPGTWRIIFDSGCDACNCTKQ